MGERRHPSQERWVAVRQRLDQRRYELTASALSFYREHERVAGTGLLCRSEWLPPRPIDLADVQLDWVSDAPPPQVDGTGTSSAHLRPEGSAGHPFRTYADAVGALAPPAVFVNRPAYRLLHVGTATGAPCLSFALGAYFDSINVGEAVAHELAAATEQGKQPSLGQLPLRSAVGDPCDLSRRPAVTAITTLTIRHDRKTGRARFVLHWRDPSKVAHAGGLYQAMPVGIFQPVNNSPASRSNDFDPWRGMVREFSEEFLGESEVHPEDGEVVAYESWPLYRRLSAARRSGEVQVSYLGLGVDPLTFATDIITVAVVEADFFDEVFSGLVTVNAEGRVTSDGDAAGVPFTAQGLAPFHSGERPMQAAGLAALRLAARFGDALLLR